MKKDNEYTIKFMSTLGESFITGYVDGNSIITVNLHKDRAATIGMSTALPVNLEKAKEYIDCMQATIKWYENHFEKEE